MPSTKKSDSWRLGAAVVMLCALAMAALPAAGAPRVVASFSILADMVRAIGGDELELDVLVEPTREAHGFEPSPADARRLGQADLFVVNGLDFEPWSSRLVQAANFSGELLVASTGVRHYQGAAPENGVDPHAWQDLANGVIYAQNIAAGLARVDPANAASYAARAQDYINSLRALDEEFRRQLAQFAPNERVFATTHDAFGYLGAAYGIKIVALVGMDSDAEPSARAMAGLLHELRGGGVRAIFPEYGQSARIMSQLARDAKLALGGHLYADTLAAPGEPAGTYLGMFRWNAQQIISGFGG